MRPFQSTISLEDALGRLLAAAVPIERTERIPLLHAAGRVIAREVVSAVDVPPFDRAGMDGYAVIAGDTTGASASTPITLRRIEKLYTGQVATSHVTHGTCIEIATGAPLPDGADAVVMVEDTQPGDGDHIKFLAAAQPRQNVGRRAADISAGQRVLAPGDLLYPSRIGAVAATGVTEVEVFARPRVAIMSTGNEIVEPGQSLRPGQIYDVNRFTLTAVIEAHGGEAIVYNTVGDTLDDLAAAVSRAEAEDLIVFSGGSSVGDRDLVMDVVGQRGEIIFHGVAIKPGKPMMLGRIGGRPTLGLPGYPTSCLSNAYVFLVPMLRQMAHLPAYRPHSVRLPLARRIVSAPQRHQFYTVRVADGTAVPAFKASGDITSMSQADGYIEIPAATDAVDAGELVEVKLF